MSVPLTPARNPRFDRPIEPSEPALDPIALDDDVAEILQEMQSVTAIAQLESRMNSFEHDISRIASSHEDESTRLASDLAIMKARIEDALGAVSATVAELRTTGAQTQAIPDLEMRRGIDHEVIDALVKAGRDEAVDVARAQAREEAQLRVAQVRIDMDAALSTIRTEFQSSFTGLLQGLESGLQTARMQAVREIERLRGLLEPEVSTLREDWADEATTLRRDLTATEETFSSALRAFATRLGGLQAAVAQASARVAADRASTNAEIHGLSARIDSLEERLTEGLARLSEGILRIAENVGSATTLQRRIAAIETAVGDAAKPKKKKS
ncbi:MAG: hypothetical protein ACRDJM_10885 [Actinomycetota bacterium]